MTKATKQAIAAQELMLVEARTRRSLIDLLKKSADQVYVLACDSAGNYLGKVKPEIVGEDVSLKFFTAPETRYDELTAMNITVSIDSFFLAPAPFNGNECPVNFAQVVLNV
jgi:hypothetical protein